MRKQIKIVYYGKRRKYKFMFMFRGVQADDTNRKIIDRTRVRKA